jgi:hypothetical protein
VPSQDCILLTLFQKTWLLQTHTPLGGAAGLVRLQKMNHSSPYWYQNKLMYAIATTGRSEDLDGLHEAAIIESF